MQNLHAHIMSLVKAHKEDNNNVKQNTDGKPNIVRQPPTTKFRMSHTGYATTVSTALYYQLERFCLANPTTPRTLKGAQPQAMSYSKAVRRAVYELMAKPQAMYQTHSRLPAVSTAPDRTHTISWTMPKAKPKDAQYLAELCSHHGVNTSTFVRRAIFLYTRDHVSHNKDDALEAIRDGWA
jgi:hypothetical protein